MSLLLQLWWLRQRGVVRGLLRSLRQPARLAGVLLVGAMLAFVVWSAWPGRTSGDDIGRDDCAVLGAMIFAMSVGSGFAQQGPRFAPADVDFLFPAPFSPRQLLLWRLLHLWPLSLLSTLFLAVAIGLRTGRPGRFVIGFALLNATALHLQLCASVLTTRLSRAAARRLRTVGRAIAIAVLLVLLLAVFERIVAGGGLAALFGSAADSAVVRVLFFPAVASVDFIFGESAASIALALLRMLAGAAGTLALLLLIDADYLEDSAATTARAARALERRAGGVVVESAEGRRGRSLLLPPWPLLFRGAGALVWKNLIVLVRSWRSVLPGILIGFVIVLPPLFASSRSAHLGVGVGALVAGTIFWSSALSFDLRREFERLAELRALPLRPGALVLAQLVVPWAIGVLLQEGLLFAWALRVPEGPGALLGAALAMPLLMFVAIVIDNMAPFLFAAKGSGGRGSGAMPAQWLRPIAWLAALAPGVLFGWALLRGGAEPLVAVAAAALVDAAIAAGLFFLLVRLYESRAAEGG